MNCSTHTNNFTIKLSNHRKRRDSYRMRNVLCSHKKGKEKHTNTQTNLIENEMRKTCHAFTRKIHVPKRKQRNFRVRIRIPVCLDNTANLSEVMNVVTQTKHVQKRTSIQV